MRRKITHPVWPVQCSTSSPASLRARNGSPAFPKIDSTKSRLLTRLPGAKNRTSIDFCGQTPGTSGQTIGRNSSDTNVRTGVFSRTKRQRQRFDRRLHRAAKQLRKDMFRHRFLVTRDRQSTLGHMERPLRRSPIAPRIVQNPVENPVGRQQFAGKRIPIRRQRKLPRNPVLIQNQRSVRQTRRPGQIQISKMRP